MGGLFVAIPETQHSRSLVTRNSQTLDVIGVELIRLDIERFGIQAFRISSID